MTFLILISLLFISNSTFAQSDSIDSMLGSIDEMVENNVISEREGLKAKYRIVHSNVRRSPASLNHIIEINDNKSLRHIQIKDILQVLEVVK